MSLITLVKSPPVSLDHLITYFLAPVTALQLSWTSPSPGSAKGLAGAACGGLPPPQLLRIRALNNAQSVGAARATGLAPNAIELKSRGPVGGPLPIDDRDDRQFRRQLPGPSGGGRGRGR